MAPGGRMWSESPIRRPYPRVRQMGGVARTLWRSLGAYRRGRWRGVVQPGPDDTARSQPTWSHATDVVLVAIGNQSHSRPRQSSYPGIVFTLGGGHATVPPRWQAVTRATLTRRRLRRTRSPLPADSSDVRSLGVRLATVAPRSPATCADWTTGARMRPTSPAGARLVLTVATTCTLNRTRGRVPMVWIPNWSGRAGSRNPRLPEDGRGPVGVRSAAWSSIRLEPHDA